MYKFKNKRKRTDKDLPEVKARKRTASNDETEVEQAKRRKLDRSWGVPNFLPPSSSMDDEHSIEDFVSFLKQQSQMSAGRRDTARIERRMNQTFAHRRNQIVCLGASVKDIKERYPILFLENEVRILTCYDCKRYIRVNRPSGKPGMFRQPGKIMEISWELKICKKSGQIMENDLKINSVFRTFLSVMFLSLLFGQCENLDVLVFTSL